MSKIEKTDSLLKYPAREKAYAYRTENKIPFKYAVIGTTFPINDYSFTGDTPSKYIRIEYIVDGKGEVLIDGEWKEAVRGDLFILRSGAIHNYRSSGQNPWHKHWFTYNSVDAEAFLDSYGIRSGIYRLPLLQQCFEDLESFVKQNPPSIHAYFEIAEYFHKIIYNLGLHLQSEQSDEAEQIRRMLDSMIYNKSSLDDIAGALHMSKSNVIRIYKKRFGATPHQYLMEKKIENGKLLLRTTSMSVREISEKLCIGDEHYFSTFFYKHVGVRPRDYRKG